jgi:hypothetical protein
MESLLKTLRALDQTVKSAPYEEDLT